MKPKITALVSLKVILLPFSIFARRPMSHEKINNKKTEFLYISLYKSEFIDSFDVILVFIKYTYNNSAFASNFYF